MTEAVPADRPSMLSRFERWYLPVMISTWCLAPGLRRLVDWQVGRTPLSILSILPLLSLLPLVIAAYARRGSPHLRVPFLTVMYLWCFGFVYALVVALTGGPRLGPIYDLVDFVLPMFVGVWVVVRTVDRAQTFTQAANWLLGWGVFESIYGIAQYISPPAWDIAYVNEANQISLGAPEPFGLHPFSTLNSPGTLGLFLAMVILVNLNRLSLRRPVLLGGVLLCVAALALTSVRSSWLAVAIGVVVFVVLSPKRVSVASALVAVGALTVFIGSNASTLAGNPTLTEQLTSRFSSLQAVDQDESAAAREAESEYALRAGLEDPLGQGLGTVGGAVKLGDSGGGQLVLDNGYLARFLEMGAPGFLFYLGAVAAALIVTFGVYLTSRAAGDQLRMEIAVASLTVQVALAGLDLSSDSHNGLAGMFFWLLAGLALRVEPADEVERSTLRVTPPARSRTGASPA